VNLKRGILIAISLYVVTMIVGVIIQLITNIILSSPQTAPTTYWVITIITTVTLTSFSSIWYFDKVKRSVKEGLKLGAIFVITGFVLDVLLFMTQRNGLELVKEYYSHLSFYSIIILVIATCVFMGSRDSIKLKEEIKHITKKHRRRNG